ncbi:MAG: glutamine synthetase III [Candidatus Lernaella stagnicola]|nr:glutamine synthetase III [Candidatus Lernaella stagnicola]
MSQVLRSTDKFAAAVFTREKMAQYMSKSAFNQMVEVIDNGAKLTPELANQVAHAMKEWALDNNASHFTHWFQPVRGVTAEKHDSFLTYENGVALDRFSGAQLVQSEPDASSFPSGGIRATFEARGYTAWDPTSPVFLAFGTKKATLVIPSVYLSYTGEVLDMKTQVLRSTAVVEQLAFKLLKKFGNRTARSVRVTCGTEQEYFLVRKEYETQRPDLLLAGRSLQGASSPKDQQFEDHYFGSIDPKVLAFMEDLDDALAARGIGYKTRHNEVAPHQYELAPTFVEANLSVDHNMQVMAIMHEIADQHGFAVLLHEKPFAGINGSGKHLNWSMADSDGRNLFEPGESPKRNIQFLTFVAAMMIGVDRFGGLLRAAVADAGNDHRLGANEAPPAIMSVFIGGYLSDVLDAIAAGKDVKEMEAATMEIRAKHVPEIAIDTTDRNRTSPVAFTGNKFEFRAVGSSQNIAEPLTVLNLIMAYGLEKILGKIDTYAKKYPKVKDAALAAVREALNETARVRFNGDNYTAEWHAEAARLGLPAAKNTPEALYTYLQEEVLALYEHFGVLTRREITAKVEIRREFYERVKILELGVLSKIAKTYVMPALVAQITQFGSAAANLRNEKGKAVLEAKLDFLSDLLHQIEDGIHRLHHVMNTTHGFDDLVDAVNYLGEEGQSALETVRAVCDTVEQEVSVEFWSLPKYTQMLHIL